MMMVMMMIIIIIMMMMMNNEFDSASCKNIRLLWLLLFSGLLLYLIYHLLLSDNFSDYLFILLYNYIPTTTTTTNITGTDNSTTSNLMMIMMNMTTISDKDNITSIHIHNKKNNNNVMNKVSIMNTTMFIQNRNRSLNNINKGFSINNITNRYSDQHIYQHHHHHLDHDDHNGDNDDSNDATSHFNSAVCILSTDISLINLSWLYELIKYNISPYIVLDSIDNNIINSTYSKYATVISINSMDSKSVGYFWAGNKHIYHRNNKNPEDFYRKYVNAWDKSLLYFTEIATQHSFVWFIEYDVYIPSMSAFLSVHNDSVVSHKADLVIRELSNTRVHKFNHFLKAPFYSSLACVVGASRKLLGIIKQYVIRNHKLEYIEILFTTLSKQHNLTIYHPLQFQAIQFRCNFTCSDVHRYPDQWFHPIKDQLHFVNDCSTRVQNRSYESIDRNISNYSSYRDDDKVDSSYSSSNRSVFLINNNTTSSSRSRNITYEHVFNSDNYTRIHFENEANCTLSK